MSQERGAQTPICSISRWGGVTISSHSVRQIPVSPQLGIPTHRLGHRLYIDVETEAFMKMHKRTHLSDTVLHTLIQTVSWDFCQETDCKTYAYWMT